MVHSKMKIVALTSMANPYTLERYSAFASKFADVSFFLVELGEKSLVYQWQFSKIKTIYPRIILSKKAPEEESFLKLFYLLKKTLDSLEPDLIVSCGYGVPGMLQALLWSIFKNIPVILLSESKEDDAKRNLWQEILKSILIKLYKSALVGAECHKKYLIKLGMPKAAIFLGYDVVNNDSFHPDKIKHLPQPIAQPYFLAINRFVPKKNLSFLISSYSQYRQNMGNLAWDLVLCGDGELRPQIERQIADLELTKFIHLPSFLQQEELLPYFAHASCFIHASIQEQWGLVVNEAMAAGLPVLVSNRCGCFEDLVIEGVNGFGFDPGNQEELVQLMVKITSNVVDLAAMGKASLEHIQKFSPDYFAEGLMQAVEYALAH
jgi:glycosyltransferase involved in cell wall biosynthesis